MRKFTVRRCTDVGWYMLENNLTVRATASDLGIAKSTVHRYVAVLLKEVEPQLYLEVRKLLNKNKAERHIRGGEATRRKFQEMRRETKNTY